MMVKSWFVLLAPFAILILAISGLSGCASHATKEAMTSDIVPGMQKHKYTVEINTQGRNETGALDLPSISKDDFASAIENSIIENGLFTKVIHGNGSDYKLNVSIVNMSTPMFGASMTASMEVAWSLQNTRSKHVAMRESIKSSYTAGAFSAFAAVTRIRYAVEGAARENIRLGLMAISKLQLE
jgi:uncharacterized protein YceK